MDWTKYVTEKSSSFSKSQQFKKQGWQKKPNFSFPKAFTLLTEMKSEHGRQPLEWEPCLLRSPRVVGRSTWHRHFFLNFLWGQQQCSAHPFTDTSRSKHASSELWWCYFGKETYLNLAVPKTLQGFGEHIVPWDWATPWCHPLLRDPDTQGTPLHTDPAPVYEAIWNGYLIAQYTVTNLDLTWQSLQTKKKSVKAPDKHKGEGAVANLNATLPTGDHEWKAAGHSISTVGLMPTHSAWVGERIRTSIWHIKLRGGEKSLQKTQRTDVWRPLTSRFICGVLASYKTGNTLLDS